MEKQAKKDKVRIEELASIESELKGEKQDLKTTLIDVWKSVRTNFTGEELTRYEKRLDTMDIWNLKEEARMLQDIIGKQQSDDAGADDSGDDDGDDSSQSKAQGAG
ncbi:hypothetical protein, partial [Oenococcus oeni]|uniref:hypothetical protein n=1 Tax=Oenococcus oeni TaxID=1247 RepID=UPI00117C9A75